MAFGTGNVKHNIIRYGHWSIRCVTLKRILLT
jgi:hypothetical protein